jgi:hypothetical protein
MTSWTSKLKNNPTDWLLDSNPWTKYKTLTELLEVNVSDNKVQEAKNELLGNEKIMALIDEANNWMPTSAARNSDAKISYFKLKALAEFGIKSSDLNIQEIVDKAEEHIIDDFFGVRGTTPERPKKGEKYEPQDLAADVWHISPCNSPVITTALLELGVKNELVTKSIDALMNKWVNKEGWFCHFFFVESQFKKLQIGCPIAGLQALEIFSKVPELKESAQVHFAFEPIKFHKEFGKTLYYFGRSKKFWTLKYPFVWYNALYLADVLTRFENLKDEPVVKELVNWIIDSQDAEGKYKPTSIFMNYKGWDFANKKEASPWITFLCCRILKQYFN